MNPGPPSAARALVSALLPEPDRRLVLGDLDEAFGWRAQEAGISSARWWYRRQVVKAVGPLLLDRLTALGRQVRAGLISGHAGLIRGLATRPSYALGVVGGVSLGLTVCAAVGILAWKVWLAPLAVPFPDRVLRLYELEENGAQASRVGVSPPLLEDLRHKTWVTVGAVAGVSSGSVAWERPGDHRRLDATWASAELFRILGLPLLAGAALQEGNDDEVVLSATFAREAFGSDLAASLGRSLVLGGASYTVVGVTRTPPGYPNRADVLLPLSFSADELSAGMRGARYLDVVVLAKEEASWDEVTAELSRAIQDLAQVHAAHEGWGGVAVPLGSDLTSGARKVLMALLLMVSSFLILAVVNAGVLAGARQLQRTADFDVMTALGAGKEHLRWVVLRELSVLGLAAGLLAAAACYALVPLAVSLAPSDLPRLETVNFSPMVGGFLVLAGLGVGATLGVVLGLASTVSPRSAPTRSRSKRTSRLRAILVSFQVAVTTLLLCMSVRVVGRVAELQRVELGFVPEGIGAAFFSFDAVDHDTPEARYEVWETFEAAFLGSGTRVGVGTNPPMGGSTMRYGFMPEGSTEQSWAQYHAVSRGYFGVLGIELEEGRVFDESDVADVVVVNESIARGFYPGGAVGRSLTLLGQEKRIVGVVSSTRHFGPADESPYELYVPLTQDPGTFAHVIAPLGTLSESRISEAAPRVGLRFSPSDLRPYNEFLSDWYASLRLQAWVVGLLSVVGVLMAALGLSALLMFHVAQRRRELGIRIALGEATDALLVRVLRQGVSLALAGVVFGAVLWMGLGPLLSDANSVPNDGSVLIPSIVGALVLVISALASLYPGITAMRLSPLESIRSD